jgi:N-dimethylarginine dimethylaminohydrolase
VPLNWGRSYLMCPAEHFGVLYEINPWMHREVAADPSRSLNQWTKVRDTLTEAGARVTTIDSVDGLPDMVFTANAGVVWGDLFIPSRFRHAERTGEESYFKLWAHRAGFSVAGLPDRPFFEGAGDALPFRGRIVAGYRTRSEFDAHTALAKVLDLEVLSVELVDPRFYHLDLTFCPLGDDHALVVPHAWDTYGREVVRSLVQSPIELTEEEANAFCANSVVVGQTIVMPSCTGRLNKELAAIGLTVVVCPVDEFLKAGGGVRCMTLALDVGAE